MEESREHGEEKMQRFMGGTEALCAIVRAPRAFVL